MSATDSRFWSEDDKRQLAVMLLREGKGYGQAAEALGRSEKECIEIAGRISARRYLRPAPVMMVPDQQPQQPVAKAAAKPAARLPGKVRCPTCGELWQPKQLGQRYCCSDCRSTATRNDHGLAL